MTKGTKKTAASRRNSETPPRPDSGNSGSAPRTSRLYTLIYPGTPVPWARTNTGAKGQRYTPKRQREHRKRLAEFIGLSVPKLEGPVGLTLNFYKDETYITIYELLGDGHKTTRPDLDNLQKQVMEAIEDSGVIEDDARICFMQAGKYSRPANP